MDLVNVNYDLATDTLIPVSNASFEIQLNLQQFADGDLPQVEAVRYDETAPNNTVLEALGTGAVRRTNGRLVITVPPFTHYQVLRIVR